MHRIIIIAGFLTFCLCGSSIRIPSVNPTAGAAFGCLPQESQHKFRNWKSANGQYKIYAQLIRVQKGKAKLRLDTGKTINVAVEKLSRFDREYIESIEGGSDNPFAGAEESDSTKGSDSKQVRSTEKLIRSINSAQTKLVGKGEWLVEPDASPKRGIPMLDDAISFQKILDKRSPYDFSDDITEVTVVDLTSGKRTAPLTINSPSNPKIAVAPSGKHAAVFIRGRGRENGRIEFIEFQSSPKIVASWQMSDFFHRGGEPFKPERGIFLSDERLLTIDRNFAAVWDWRRGNAIYAFEIDFGLAYSPDGKFLSGIDSGTASIWIYDLTKNTLAKRVGASHGTPQFRWVGNDYLLVSDSDLVDIALGATVWKFKRGGLGKLVGTHDARFWWVTDKQVTPINLLTTKVTNELDQLKNDKLNPEDLKLLKPGTEISVELDVEFEQDEILKIRHKVVEKLESRGLVIRDDAEILLTLKLTDQEEEKLTVSSRRIPGVPAIPRPRNFPGFPKEEPDETVTSRPKKGSITLKEGKRVLWGKTRVFGPFGGTLRQKENETAQQAIDRLCTADPRFFTNWKLPTNHARLPSGEPLGTSTISDEGIR